ncbi:unnamed protein product [Chrysoparadoxa australica]
MPSRHRRRPPTPPPPPHVAERIVRARPVDCSKKLSVIFADQVEQGSIDRFSLLFLDEEDEGWGVGSSIGLGSPDGALSFLAGAREGSVANIPSGEVSVPCWKEVKCTLSTSPDFIQAKSSGLLECPGTDTFTDYDADSDDESFLQSLNKRYSQVLRQKTQSGAGSPKGKKRGRKKARPELVVELHTLEQMVEVLERENYLVAQDRSIHDDAAKLDREHEEVQSRVDHLLDEACSVLAQGCGSLRRKRAKGPCSPGGGESVVLVSEEEAAQALAIALGEADRSKRRPKEEEKDLSSEVQGDILSETRAVELLAPLLGDLVVKANAPIIALDAGLRLSKKMLAVLHKLKPDVRLLVEVYHHWMKKRTGHGPLLRCFHSFPWIENWKNAGHGSERAGDSEGADLLQAYKTLCDLRQDLDRARLVMDVVKRREKLKRDWLRTSAQFWGSACETAARTGEPRGDELMQAVLQLVKEKGPSLKFEYAGIQPTEQDPAERVEGEHEVESAAPEENRSPDGKEKAEGRKRKYEGKTSGKSKSSCTSAARGKPNNADILKGNKRPGPNLEQRHVKVKRGGKSEERVRVRRCKPAKGTLRE